MSAIEHIGKFTIDDFGRLVIPGKLRTLLNWELGSKIDMYYADGNTAILQLAKEESELTLCAVCEEADGTIMVKGVFICNDCVNNVAKFKTL